MENLDNILFIELIAIIVAFFVFPAALPIACGIFLLTGLFFIITAVFSGLFSK